MFFSFLAKRASNCSVVIRSRLHFLLSRLLQVAEQVLRSDRLLSGRGFLHSKHCFFGIGIAPENDWILSKCVRLVVRIKKAPGFEAGAKRCLSNEGTGLAGCANYLRKHNPYSLGGGCTKNYSKTVNRNATERTKPPGRRDI